MKLSEKWVEQPTETMDEESRQLLTMQKHRNPRLTRSALLSIHFVFRVIRLNPDFVTNSRVEKDFRINRMIGIFVCLFSRIVYICLIERELLSD